MVAIGAVGNGEPTGQPPRIRHIAESGTILTRLIHTDGDQPR
jgi:hypothetical protein